ncbi:hypothetical protein [Streptomyces cuspidosporus]|uniref:AAA+ ATPase domain-containing protein n=1 Tax=Streptomyces cuspidosporus TaxID=66882 RepID=A0ABP5U6Y0_9ACTN
MSALIGLGGDELQAIGVDLSDGVPAFVIAGPASSGKSTLLLTMGLSLLKDGTHLIVAAPRQSPVRTLMGQAGVLKVFTDPDFTAEDLRAAQAQACGSSVVILLDDIEVLFDVTNADEWMDDVLKQRPGDLAFVVAGDTEEAFASAYRGFGAYAQRARRGVLLGPRGAYDGEVIGARVPRQEVELNRRVGRGLLHLDNNRVMPIALPQPPG